MGYDKKKVDEMVLALLYLTTFRDKLEVRAWKGLDWDSLNRLHERGYISDPRVKPRRGTTVRRAIQKAFREGG
jgi:hypothetical protein